MSKKNEKNNIKGLLEEEKSRIAILESFIKLTYKQSVKVDAQGNQYLDLTTKELKDLVEAEDKLMDLKRKVLGITG